MPATQVLPSWLTLSTTVITEPDGSITTSSATLTLPLTYYGPSIPLGPNWTWGGLTPPIPTSITVSASPMTSPMPTSSATSTANPYSSESSVLSSESTALSAQSSSLSSAASALSSESTALSAWSSTLASESSSLSSWSSGLASASGLAASSSATTVASAASSHSIAASTLGAILGALLGTLVLLILLLIFLMLRRARRRNSPKGSPRASSSFWNRETTLFSRLGRKGGGDDAGRRTTPIWTEWQFVGDGDLHDSPDGHEPDPRSPGEGSPRDSGDEADPFLTRRSGGSNEMSHTRTDSGTLVSMPAAAAVGTGSTHRSGYKVGGPIIPRAELLARMRESEDQDAANRPPTPQVRVVHATPSEPNSPLPLSPPPPFTSRFVHGADSKSSRSILSQPLSARSAAFSEKSGSFQEPEPEPAELLTARRVKVGNEYGHPDVDGHGARLWAGGSSGLERLANLSRLSWFRRMSFLPGPSGTRHSDAPTIPDETSDKFTRTPPRSHSRQGSFTRSRPVSWAPLPTQEHINPTRTPDSSYGTRPRPLSRLSGRGLGLGMTGERPVSNVSARSRTSVASGGTTYFTPLSSSVDVSSLPGTGMGSMGSRQSAPPVPQISQITTSGGYLAVPGGDPPTYEESHQHASSGSSGDSGSHAYEGSRSNSDNDNNNRDSQNDQSGNDEDHGDDGDHDSAVDILDMPAPRPASPFTAVNQAPEAPPGLPNPLAWRDSHATTEGTSDSAGIQIDVLEDEPPVAREGWRSLAANSSGSLMDRSNGRRTTFGLPTVIYPRDALVSERGSLYSMRSHLSPRSPLSPAGSHPASIHTHQSSSSRPSMHSQLASNSSGGAGSLAHSSSVSEDDRWPRRRPGAGVGEVGFSSPPLSAVFARDGSWEAGHGRPTSPLAQPSVMPSQPGVPPAQARHPQLASASSGSEGPLLFTSTGAVSGTVTSSGTARTDDSTSSSLTTAVTDPVTGAVLHFPALPWRSRAQENGWETLYGDEPMW